MNCPVCNFAEISEHHRVCPQCKSDLDAIHLVMKIGNKSRFRKITGIVMSSLALIFLAFLIVGFINKGNLTQKSTPGITPEEINALKGELENVRAENNELQTINAGLQSQVTTLEKAKAKREMIYVVKEGETLFLLARKILGNGYKYLDIVRDNNLADPDKLTAGQNLIIYY